MSSPSPETTDPEKLRRQKLFCRFEYSKADVMVATGVTGKAIEHMVKPGGPLRNFVQQGHPMKFTGMNILQIEVMRRLQVLGVSHAASRAMREEITKHLEYQLGDLPVPAVKKLALYPYSTKDHPDRTEWACVLYVEGKTWVPPEVIIVDVNRVIDETAAKLHAIREDEEVPIFHPLFEAARHAEGVKENK